MKNVRSIMKRCLATQQKTTSMVLVFGEMIIEAPRKEKEWLHSGKAGLGLDLHPLLARDLLEDFKLGKGCEAAERKKK